MVSKASAGIIVASDIAFYRWAMATVLLAPLAGAQLGRRRSTILAEVPRAVVLGLLGSALFPWLMYLAAATTSATNIGLFQALLPVFAIVFARALLGTPITPVMVAGAAISLVGVAVVVVGADPAGASMALLNRGDMLMLAATACFALYSVLLGLWKTSLPLTADLFGQSLAATIFLLPLFWSTPSQPFALPSLWLVGYAALCASIVAPMLWMRGIAGIGPARAAMLFNLLPLVTAGLAIAFLEEQLTPGLVPGGTITIIGVAVVQRARKP